MEITPFYIGQVVICVKSHSEGYVIKGQKYTVTAVSGLGDCDCPKVGVNNIKARWESSVSTCMCTLCSAIYKKPIYKGFAIQLFAPAQESPFPSLTYSKVVEKESELISQN